MKISRVHIYLQLFNERINIVVIVNYYYIIEFII